MNIAYINELRELVSKNNQYTNLLLHNSNYKHLLDFILDNTPLLKDDFYTLKTKIFWVLNDIHQFPRCKTCGNEIKSKNVFRLNQPEIYNYCSTKCMHNNPSIKQRKRDLLMQKYGVENVFQLKEIKEKSKNTLLNRYGVDHYSKSDRWNEQVRLTSLEHYGTEHPHQSEEVKEQCRKTCLEKYGCEYATQSQEQKDKIVQTCLKRYGVRRYTQTKEFVEKTKKTKLERYGDQNYINVEKIKKTSLERYGVENPGATFDSISKAKRRLKYDGIYFSSSPELAYYVWLKDNNIKFKYQPKEKAIVYVDQLGTSHTYYPDFYIIDKDELHEIKGENHFQDFDVTKPMIWPGKPEKNYIAYAKWKCMLDNNVIILTNKDYKTYVDYAIKKFGNGSNWYKKFKYERKNVDIVGHEIH